MRTWLRQLDDLLRGRATSPESLVEGRIALPARRFVVLAIVLGGVFGFFMGWYAYLRGSPDSAWQVLASMVKLPALFLLTLVVTFPSLYVFNALMGCRLSFMATLRLLIGAILVNVTVAASLGPILGFFTLSTTSYPFMILLNVALLAVAGVVALGFLLHTLRRLSLPRWQEIESAGPEAADRPGGAGRAPDVVDAEQYAQARSIFRVWVLIYGLVGAQMGWLLRPFIGNPNIPFEWFRSREGNFFSAVMQQLHNLLPID
ncbi:MAG TPA: hypothetical protein P5572_20085 [Phycisphaerae bacterium]|nr:hypothetical protein [Phycisphaerae bacterium]